MMDLMYNTPHMQETKILITKKFVEQHLQGFDNEQSKVA